MARRVAQIVYCNAEGIQWIDHDRVIIVSDKAKTKQPFYCDAKDQSVHIFAVPARATLHGLTVIRSKPSSRPTDE